VNRRQVVDSDDSDEAVKFMPKPSTTKKAAKSRSNKQNLQKTNTVSDDDDSKSVSRDKAAEEHEEGARSQVGDFLCVLCIVST
jgi:hypothetical protein